MSNSVNEIKTLSKIDFSKVAVNDEYFDIVVGLIRKKLSLNRIYSDKYYTYIDEEDEREKMKDIIAIEKSLYYYDKYFKYKQKLEASELYKIRIK